MSSDAEYMLRSLQSEMYTLEDEVAYLRQRIKALEGKIVSEQKIANDLASLLYSLEQENNFQVKRNDALIAYEQARR
jgi:predicted  nucleic acid-binding Zn-ribbon protein